MKSKFAMYALAVTILSSTVSWSRLISSASSNTSSSNGYGSSWNSHTSGGGGFSGGHK